MSSDIEFLRQRLALVEQQIAHPSPYQSQGQDKGRLRYAYHTRQNTTYQREARLLRKLLARARPGHVLQLLTLWRQQLGQFTVDYRREHKETIRAYDEWSQLPHHLQVREPEPSRPPAPRYIDHDGAPWIVDDRLLALLDDLIERLHKWLTDDTTSSDAQITSISSNT